MGCLTKLNNQIILQGQGQGERGKKKNTPEEKLLLSPVKTEEDIALTLKYLNTAVKSEA